MAKKKTILDLIEMKEKGEKAAWMVLYDSCFASYAEEAGMDMILVGDSMGMIVYGFDGTVPVTMEMSIDHCKGVRKGAPNTYLIGDMPFGSYHASVEDAVNNAVRFIKDGEVDAIKLEGGVSVADKIEAISKAGITVFGHIGLTPQSSAALGGFKVQGKNIDTAKAIIEDSIAVYKAGARTLLLEGVRDSGAATAGYSGEPGRFFLKACPKRFVPSCIKFFPYPFMESVPESSVTGRCFWRLMPLECTRILHRNLPKNIVTSEKLPRRG